MKTIDVYKQYFSAACTFNGVERRGAAVWLTAESDCGMIRYEVGEGIEKKQEDFAAEVAAQMAGK